MITSHLWINGAREVLIKNAMNDQLKAIDSRTPIETAYNLIMSSPESPVIITNNNQLVGVLDADNLLEFIMTRRALTLHR